MVDESTDMLEHCDVVAREALTSRRINSIEVDKEVVRISGTVVAELSGVMVKELEIDACQERKNVGISKSISVDKCQQCYDQVGSSLFKPGLNLEVALGCNLVTNGLGGLNQQYIWEHYYNYSIMKKKLKFLVKLWRLRGKIRKEFEE
ncbi:hypothetical protein CsSME_00012459 [Camellia sinensis var. sinensis]